MDYGLWWLVAMLQPNNTDVLTNLSLTKKWQAHFLAHSRVKECYIYSRKSSTLALKRTTSELPTMPFVRKTDISQCYFTEIVVFRRLAD